MRFLFLLTAVCAPLVAQQTAAPPPPPAANSAPQQSPQPAALPPQSVTAAPAAKTSAPPAVPAMSPADAYDYAMQPFLNARGAPDDLTAADQWALGVGVARARDHCEALAKENLQGEDLLAYGKLCIFGRDLDAARHSLIDYLAIPTAKAPEVGRLLLTRAFIGLHSIASAESQVESLVSFYPYDASIHLAFDMVIDAAEASGSADDLGVISRLNELQLPHILDALAHGGAVPASNGDSVDSALLVRDALRIADTLRRSHKHENAAKIVAEVRSDIEAPAILNSAGYPSIRNALTRYDLYAQTSPVRSFHGAALPVTGPIPARVIPLYDTNPAAHRIVPASGGHISIRTPDDRTLVLLFSIAGPESGPAIQHIVSDLAKDHITPGLRVIAVTSWAANIGVDSPTPELLASLRAFRGTLPAALPVYIVPDSELKPFAIDTGPEAILLDRKGRILWLNTLSGSAGSIRQIERDIESQPPLPPM